MARSQTLHEYNISRLNIWFAALAVLMVVVVVGMVFDDYNRSWKKYQREFVRLEQEQLGEARLAASEKIKEDRLTKAEERLTEARTELVAQREQLSELDKKHIQVHSEWYRIDQNFRFYKAEYDVVKYEFAVANERHDEAKAEAAGVKLAEMGLELQRMRVAREDAIARREAIEAQMDELRDAETKAQARLAKITEDVDLIDKRLATIQDNWFNKARNAAMLDFIQPSLRVNQILPAGLTYDVNFGVTDRVDRCTTCHLGIDNPRWEDAPQPFTTHPDLDTYVAAASSHPLTDFGCTECHGGRPRGVEFSRAAHTPRDEEQRKEWEEKYGYHKMHHWVLPMLTADDYEAGCVKCHTGVREIPKADTYNAGRQLVEHFGCQGCHKIDGYEDMAKTGPSLKRIADKLTPEFAYRWISDPKLVRPHSVMPQIFHLQNVVGGKDGDPTYWSRRTTAEINGIVAYLFDKSETTDFASAAVPRGNPQRGQQLFESVGCQACHLVAEEEDALEVVGVSPRQFGPNLEAVASKSTIAWTYHWLKDPKSYDPTTRMPNMRLTDQEASDITAYLRTLRADTTTPYGQEPSDPEMVYEILMDYLSNTQPVATAAAQLDAMDERAREVLLGERVIGRQGCFGCHLIEGFEETLPIGTELSGEGSKPLNKFAFNNQHGVEHSVKAWIEHKMLEPRSYDEGMHLLPLEKSRMPRFNMTEEQAKLVTSNVLSWTKHTVPQENQRNLSASEQQAARGEKLVASRNCRGCHIIEGQGGAIASLIEDTGYHPPNLFNEGAKVQPDWLVRFLHEVSPIRPWLNVRMPSFEFTEEERGVVANYFMAVADAHDNPYPQADLLTYADSGSGSGLFELYKCQQCHPSGALSADAPSASELAPNLSLAKNRLRPDWIVSWLTDPQSQMPGTRMPNFFYDDGEYFTDEAPEEIEALRDYLMTLE